MTGAPASRLAPRGDALDRALDRAGGGRAIPGNAVTPLFDGPAIFDEALRMITKASQWIHFDNYIVRADRTGRRFAEALIERARAGVRVRVLVDWLGSVGTPARFWRSLRAAGVEVRVFGPPRVLAPARFAMRNHRKLIAVDGRMAILGGFCIGDEWTGDPNRGILPWRETGLLIQGPATPQLDRAFAGAWTAAGGVVPARDHAPDVPEAGEALVRVLAGEPGKQRAFRTFDLLLAIAGERVWITDAYFVAPPRFRDALTDAARAGVDVRLLVPGMSDLPIVRNLTRVGYRPLLRSGLRVFEWQGPMLHAKTAVVDGRWTRVGSSNLNPSSILLNYEVDVLVDDRSLAEAMEHRFRHDLDCSAEVVRRRVGPETLGRLQPVRLAVHGPEHALVHRIRLRERRRRAVLLLRAMLGGARRSIFLPVSFVALFVAGLFFLIPGPMGVIAGLVSAWIAVGAGVEALGRSDQ